MKVNRWYKKSAMAGALCWIAGSASAAQHAHVHGQATLLIAQEGEHWRAEFSIPQEDMKSAHTKKQAVLIASLKHNPQKAVSLQGNCDQEPMNENNHHEHEPQKHDEHSSHQTADHESESHNHYDINIEYHFHCEGDVTGVNVALFGSLPSLLGVNVQWITDGGQGMRTLTPSAPDVSWN